MRIEIGAPVVLVQGVDSLWHLPVLDDLGQAMAHGSTECWPTLCGLDGGVYAYGPLVRRQLRMCGVCLRRSPAEHLIPVVPRLRERRIVSRPRRAALASM